LNKSAQLETAKLGIFKNRMNQFL